MDRRDLIEKLKALWEQGVDIGIRLTAKTEVLERAYESLVQRPSPKKEPGLSLELLSAHIFPRLSVDTLYRFYLTSSRVRPSIDNRHLWKRLIERDLRFVPKFEVDYKLHYLRATDIPIAATAILYRSDERMKKVVSSYYGNIHVFRNGEVRSNEGTFRLRFGERVRTAFYLSSHVAYPMDGQIVLLTYSGLLFTLTGKEIGLLRRPGGKIVFASGYGIVDEQGQFFHWPNRRENTYLHKPLPGKVINIDGKYALTDKGLVYNLDDWKQPLTPIRIGVHWMKVLLREYKLLYVNEDESIEYEPQNGPIKRYPLRLAIGLGPHGFIDTDLKFISVDGFGIEVGFGDLSNKSIIQGNNTHPGGGVVRVLE